MDLNEGPPWTGGGLRRLGVALVSGERPPRDGPSYDDVLLWYTDLCAEVSARIVVADWQSCAIDPLDVSSRPKTRDTIVEKLGRMSTTLDRVQDLAGIRVDSDFLLHEQTAFADEVANMFDDVKVKDIRESPHSGYRAIHLHVKVPAGRCEVQIRTRAQSAWANAYEALADTFGRGVRYGQKHPIGAVEQLIGQFHKMSDRIARAEDRLQFCAHCHARVAELRDADDPSTDSLEMATSIEDRATTLEHRVKAQIDQHLETLQTAERTLRGLQG